MHQSSSMVTSKRFVKRTVSFFPFWAQRSISSQISRLACSSLRIGDSLAILRALVAFTSHFSMMLSLVHVGQMTPTITNVDFPHFSIRIISKKNVNSFVACFIFSKALAKRNRIKDVFIFVRMILFYIEKVFANPFFPCHLSSFLLTKYIITFLVIL